MGEGFSGRASVSTKARPVSACRARRPVTFCQRRMAKSTSSGSSSATGDSAGPFGCQYGRTAATKWIEDKAIPAAAVPDQISDQGDGLDPWMELKVTLPGRAKSIDPGVIQHVRSIATFATELEIIDVRPGPAFKNCDGSCLDR